MFKFYIFAAHQTKKMMLQVEILVRNIS